MMESLPVMAEKERPRSDTLELESAVLARLLEEVRNNAVSAPTAYNRMHNRHNR